MVKFTCLRNMAAGVRSVACLRKWLMAGTTRAPSIAPEHKNSALRPVSEQHHSQPVEEKQDLSLVRSLPAARENQHPDWIVLAEENRSVGPQAM